MVINLEEQAGVCILRCQGRFIAGPELEYMQCKLEEIKSRNCRRLLVDFREVPCIGSMGIAFIVGLYSSVIRNPGGRFVLVGAAPLVLRVLDLTRLSTVIPLASDMSSGLAALRDGRRRDTQQHSATA